MKERQKPYLGHFRFFYINVYKVKKLLFGQIHLFPHDFFLQIGLGRAKYGLFKQFKLDYKLPTRK